MSFLKDNEHFLRHLKSAMKGISDETRISKYIQEFRSDARKRMSIAYTKLNGDIASKLDYYQSLIVTFESLEIDYIVLNIYFEIDADSLFNQLQPAFEVLSRSGISFNPILDYHIESYNGSRIRGFLKNYFITTIGLSESDWEKEEKVNNPLITRLTEWLGERIVSEDCDVQNVERVLLHYTKLWNIYYCSPYDYSKGFVIFHKLIELYKKLDARLIKINFYECIVRIQNLIEELYPLVFNSPLTDIGGHSFYKAESLKPLPQRVNIYLVKVEEFHKMLRDDHVLFKDLKNENWISLIQSFCSQPQRFGFLFIDELIRRKNLGIVPKATEINQFVNLINSQKIDSHAIAEILKEVSRENYIFFV